MNLDYFKNILVIFLSVFVFLHLFVRDMEFGTCVQMSMLAAGLYVVYFIVKTLSGGNNDPKIN